MSDSLTPNTLEIIKRKSVEPGTERGWQFYPTNTTTHIIIYLSLELKPTHDFFICQNTCWKVWSSHVIINLPDKGSFLIR